MSSRRAGHGTDDLSCKLLGVDKHDCLCRQLLRGVSACCGEIITQDCIAGSASSGTSNDRPSRSTRRPVNDGGSSGYRPEFRWAIIRCSPPPVREWAAVVAHDVERPDVEVLDAIPFVQIVEGSPLAQCPAHKPPGVASVPCGWRANSRFNIGGELCQAQEVISVDARERSPVTGRHLLRIPSRGPAASR